MSTTLTREDMEAKLCRLAAEVAGVDPGTVTLDTHLFADLNFDSLDAVDYVMKIEDEYEVDIRAEQAQDVKTVRQAADLLWPLSSP